MFQKRKMSGKGKTAGKGGTKGVKSRTSGEVITPPPTTKPPPVVEPRDADSVVKGSVCQSGSEVTSSTDPCVIGHLL